MNAIVATRLPASGTAAAVPRPQSSAATARQRRRGKRSTSAPTTGPTSTPGTVRGEHGQRHGRAAALGEGDDRQADRRRPGGNHHRGPGELQPHQAPVAGGAADGGDGDRRGTPDGGARSSHASFCQAGEPAVRRPRRSPVRRLGLECVARPGPAPCCRSHHRRRVLAFALLTRPACRGPATAARRGERGRRAPRPGDELGRASSAVLGAFSVVRRAAAAEGVVSAVADLDDPNGWTGYYPDPPVPRPGLHALRARRAPGGDAAGRRAAVLPGGRRPRRRLLPREVRADPRDRRQRGHRPDATSCCTSSARAPSRPTSPYRSRCCARSGTPSTAAPPARSSRVLLRLARPASDNRWRRFDDSGVSGS